MNAFPKTLQYYKFCAYGFLKNLRFFDVFFLLFLRDSGMSYLEIGTLYSIRQITVNLLEIPSGLIADALGRKSAMIFAMLSYLISFCIFYLAHHFFHFSIAMIAFGIGEAFRSGTHKAMILEYLKLQNLLSIKTRFYGGTRSWSQFGSAISSLLAMVIVFISGDYRNLFIISFIPYLLDLILLSTYPKELNGRLKVDKDNTGLNSITGGFRQTFTDFIAIFKNAASVKAIFSAAAYVALFKSLKDYLQPILKTTALSLPFLIAFETEKRTAVLIGIIYFFIFLLTSFASRKAWKIEQRIKRLPKAIDLVYLTGVVSIGLSGILLWLNLPVLAVLSFVGLYLIQNIRRPLMVSYLSELISSKVMASGLSAESQLQTVLIAVYAPLLGLIIDISGITGGLMISSLLFILLFPLIRLSAIDNV